MMKNRFAFTMLELIFVIVVMGIIGKFGVEFLAQAYRSFIFTNINNELQSNSASAVEIIAARLQHRIKDSVIAREGATTAPIAIGSAVAGTTYDVLEWVGVDNDGYRGLSVNSTPYLPNWSGIIDLDDSNQTTLSSPDTNFTSVNNLILNLSYQKSNIADSALYIIGGNSDIQTGYGWDGNLAEINLQQGAMHPVTSNADNQFTSSIAGVNFAGVDVFEYYKLAWTAYAIVYQDNGNDSGTLRLFWNYQPWLGESFNNPAAANVQSAIIMENVSTFQFISIGSILKIQVCVKSNLVEDYSLCKEKTVF